MQGVDIVGDDRDGAVAGLARRAVDGEPAFYAGVFSVMTVMAFCIIGAFPC